MILLERRTRIVQLAGYDISIYTTQVVEKRRLKPLEGWVCPRTVEIHRNLVNVRKFRQFCGLTHWTSKLVSVLSWTAADVL